MPSARTKDQAKTRPLKLVHGTSVSTAVHQLRELIVHGKLSPGTWIVEGDLAKRLHVSRTPIRAALNKLQQEGYVREHRMANKSRMIVAPLTKEDADELYLIIGRLEGLAGRNTAALPQAKRMKIVQQLKTLNHQLVDIKDDHSRQGSIFEIDRDFHRLVVSCSGPRLSAWHRAIEPQAERYWRLYASSIISDLQPSIAEHNDIIRALADGDPDRVDRCLQINWDNGCKRLFRVIDVFGERGSW
jgi:DNA-binding GntR family transcriptional regulator